ncbi:hypothetical protein [Halobaculum lipolyticum]|uniref:Response regulatory domain-containing protein n=1 Tax=Halobaculum lipolyticum TaxID=3032001 RepID=A0ABD5W8C8_9EURY|nr:hypothetical protein [Halobaculum sp. DT31]
MSTQHTSGGGTGGTATDARSIRVVHVERDEGVATLTEQYLSSTAPPVDSRPIGDVGRVAAAVREGVDCVVTDHRPPLTDAGDVVDAVHGVDPDVPVVVFSAAPDRNVAGAAGAVAKRAGLEGLDRLVDRVVDAVGRPDRE